jgi:hypothetical protein
MRKCGKLSSTIFVSARWRWKASDLVTRPLALGAGVLAACLQSSSYEGDMQRLLCEEALHYVQLILWLVWLCICLEGGQPDGTRFIAECLVVVVGVQLLHGHHFWRSCAVC